MIVPWLKIAAVTVCSVLFGLYVLAIWMTSNFVPVHHFGFLGLIVVLSVREIISQARTLVADKRRHEGRCVRCGYDLRVSVTRCPECGTTIELQPDPPTKHEAGHE